MSIVILCFFLIGCTQSKNGSDEKVHKADQLEVEVKTKRIEPSDFLKVKGKNIFTQYGKGALIQLKGVNVGGYLLQEFWMTPTKASANVKDETDLYKYLKETYGEDRGLALIKTYQEHYFSEADFERMKALHVNVVRLPFWYRNIVDEDGSFYENWYEKFDWFIEQAGEKGIYVILDFHGAPGSQNGSDHSGLDGGDDKEAASKFFFGDEPTVKANQALYFEIWEAIAKRYENNPVVAGYDLLNEPYCTYRYNSSKEVDVLHESLWSLYNETYERIRKIDSNHIIIMEATWDPVDLPNPKTYGWENIVYEYHNYLYDDYNNDQGLQILNMEKKLNLIKNAGYDLPSFMGEFSYFNHYETWDEGLTLLDEFGMHYTMWTYKVTSDYGNWGLYHHTGGDINIEKVDDEKLEIIWSKVGDVRPNQRLIDVVTPHFERASTPQK